MYLKALNVHRKCLKPSNINASKHFLLVVLHHFTPLLHHLNWNLTMFITVNRLLPFV